MRTIKHIVIHATATPPDLDIGVKEIRRWHKEKGWSDIGYHYVIRRDGTLEYGRPLEKIGAHVKGYNKHSIGIALAGGVSKYGKPEMNYTNEQIQTMFELLGSLKSDFPEAEILGHRDFPGVKKACPSFDVREFLDERLGI